MPTDRRPAALIPAPLARMLGFALLATLGAAEWGRMLEGGGLADGLPWVLAAVLAGETVGAAGSLPPRLRVPAATLAGALGLLLAALASGVEPRLLAPAHWDELGSGVGRGLEALSGVTLPYGGADPWPDVTLRLGGALLVTLAALLAAWPRAEGRGYSFFALAALLVLVATPITAIGSPRSLVLGTALAALTVCFLWLERLPLRPGIGVAVLGGIALAGALPLSAAADRDGPWFDYRTWAEGLGTPASVRFDWDHSYGPLRWQRDGREMLRIKTDRPQYWKLKNLEDFDGQRWVVRGAPDPYGPEPEADLEQGWTTSEQWTGGARVTVRGLRGDAFAGAGTTIAVDAGARRALTTFSPGTWQSDAELKAGESYRVRFHAPRPNGLELSAASSGARGQQDDALEVLLPLLRPELPAPGERSRPVTAVKLELRPYGTFGPPLALNERRDTTEPGGPALRNSPYWQTWQLAQRLKRGTRTPYEYVRRVDAYLGRDFRYDERPQPPEPGQAPLEHFLFDTKAGYCQHFSGAMALLLRFGGVPARVASGFSPGGFRRRQQEWVVRDRDAHSWVEAWFDGIGWVTFDPTPTATPARSLIAAIDDPDDAAAGDSAADAAATQPGGARNPAGLRRELEQPAASGGPGLTTADDGPSTLLLVGGGLVLALAGGAVLLWRRRRRSQAPLPPADRAVADLVTALRRAGRPIAPGTTLTELERKLGGTRGGATYLATLRAARYGTSDSVPTAGQRRAFRRELGAGLGWRGRLRSWWALPPQLR
ncbi:MAG TPA: transglutaminaseTgpA domain-containing protein [Solirubrobacteraceae bacterium]|nr:transglutaminaseTgpA domain-containing protein [Solirubrobacteraceae bacterium]